MDRVSTVSKVGRCIWWKNIDNTEYYIPITEIESVVVADRAYGKGMCILTRNKNFYDMRYSQELLDIICGDD